MSVFGFHSPKIRGKYIELRQTTKILVLQRLHWGLKIVFKTLQIKL